VETYWLAAGGDVSPRHLEGNVDGRGDGELWYEVEEAQVRTQRKLGSRTGDLFMGSK